MSSEPDRLARAGNYVLGMMDAAERERAEQDLMVDADFRNAVMQVAERMQLFEVPGSDRTSDSWEAVAARLADLPQMRAMKLRDAPPALDAMRMKPASRRDGQESLTSGRRVLLLVVVLAAAIAVGFVAGRLYGAPVTVAGETR